MNYFLKLNYAWFFNAEQFNSNTEKVSKQIQSSWAHTWRQKELKVQNLLQKVHMQYLKKIFSLLKIKIESWNDFYYFCTSGNWNNNPLRCLYFSWINLQQLLSYLRLNAYMAFWTCVKIDNIISIPKCAFTKIKFVSFVIMTSTTQKSHLNAHELSPNKGLTCKYEYDSWKC